ncbi:MAG: hypothetical protein WCN87_00645 [Chlamydiota bacterium]
MSSIFLDPNTNIQGHLPLRTEHLPFGYKALNEREETVSNLGQGVLRNTTPYRSGLTPNDFIDALMPSYTNSCDRLRDLTNEIHEQNTAISTLRELKQMIRKLQQEMGEIDLDKVEALKALLEKCQKEYGLMVPEKQKLDKEAITALMHNIEDVSDNFSDIGDEKRLRFKKLSSDSDATLRLLVEMMNVFQSLRQSIISNFRAH